MVQIIEIRTYALKAGTSELFNQLMRGQSVPMLCAAGTDVVAACPSRDLLHAYLLIRSYPSPAHRSQSQARFYGSAAWTKGPRDAIMACIDFYTTVVVEADQSMIDGLRHLHPPCSMRIDRISFSDATALDTHNKDKTMLQMKPGCECCDKDLPAEETGARIFSFECTFCEDCATSFSAKCPNCGSELVTRPRRSLDRQINYPASTQRVHKPAGCARQN